MGRAEMTAWVTWVHDEHLELAYRCISAAYRFAVRPGEGHRSNLYGTIRAEPGGGYRLSTGHEDDPGLVLRDDNERAEFVAYLVERYCNERYPTMEAWEERRHASYGADLHDWVSEPPGPHPQSSTSPPPRPSPN